MAIVKNIFRHLVFPATVALGLEKLLSSGTTNKRLILCYHGSNPNPDFRLNGRHMPVNQFEQHLLYFKKNFKVVSLTEIFRLYREQVTPAKNTVALTFDDGYLNNYTQIFPLLKKYDMPATFFIVSSSLVDDSYVLWPDIIDIIKRYSGMKVLHLSTGIFTDKPRGGYYSEESGISLSDHIKKMGLEREAFLQELMVKTNFKELLKKAPEENYKFINAEQLRVMAGSPVVEIGSHSHCHFNLGNIGLGIVEKEVVRSKKILEEKIGKPVWSIAFPDGSYNDQVKKACVAAGYRDQVAVSYQCVSDTSDQDTLPRLTISNTTTFASNMIQVNLGFKTRGF